MIHISYCSGIISKTQCKHLCHFLTAERFSNIISMRLNICVTKEPMLMHLLSQNVLLVWISFLKLSYSKHILNPVGNLLSIVQLLVTKLVCFIYLFSEYSFLSFSSSHALKVTELMIHSTKCKACNIGPKKKLFIAFHYLDSFWNILQHMLFRAAISSKSEHFRNTNSFSAWLCDSFPFLCYNVLWQINNIFTL